jgi:hypothetical protein
MDVWEGLGYSRLRCILQICEDPCHERVLIHVDALCVAQEKLATTTVTLRILTPIVVDWTSVMQRLLCPSRLFRTRWPLRCWCCVGMLPRWIRGKNGVAECSVFPDNQALLCVLSGRRGEGWSL